MLSLLTATRTGGVCRSQLKLRGAVRRGLCLVRFVEPQEIHWRLGDQSSTGGTWQSGWEVARERRLTLFRVPYGPLELQRLDARCGPLEVLLRGLDGLDEILHVLPGSAELPVDPHHLALKKPDSTVEADLRCFSRSCCLVRGLVHGPGRHQGRCRSSRHRLRTQNDVEKSPWCRRNARCDFERVARHRP